MVILYYSGFEALTQIQNLLKSTDYAPAIKESLIVDASNKFFTVIPSIHPHVIKDEDDFESKVHGDAAYSICFVLGSFLFCASFMLMFSSFFANQTYSILP